MPCRTSRRHPPARGGNAQSYDLTGCEFCTLSSLLEVGGESMLHARAVQHEHPRQRTRRLPTSCAMLCHRALCIFLTTPLSYAAVAFYGGQYKKLLCYGKLATSYLFTSLGPSADCRGLTQVPTYQERTGHARGAAFSVSQRGFSLGWGLQGKVARTPHQSKGSGGTVWSGEGMKALRNV